MMKVVNFNLQKGKKIIKMNGHPWGDAMIVGLLAVLMTFLFTGHARAQQNCNHLMLGAGMLYERGLDATLAYQHTNRYHHAWEFFGTFYIKYDEDPLAGHITKESFWHNYNSWHLGVAYKPCVNRGRNHHGNVRLGVTLGSDLDRFVGGLHVGYEHSYALYHGSEFFFQVKEDVIIKGEDLFRTGVAVGIKVPLGSY